MNILEIKEILSPDKLLETYKPSSEDIEFINSYLGVPVKYVSNGPGRDQIVHL
jgi:adenylosuccinate synthase